MREPGFPRWAPWVTLPLALVGAGLSVYLTVVHYTEPTALACPATGAINCTKVTTSAQSSLLGVPVAVLGLLYFLGMTALLVPAAWRSPSRTVRGLRVGGAVAGIAMVLWLVYAEVVILHAICLWCTAVHIVMFALFVAIVAASVWRVDVAPCTDSAEEEQVHRAFSDSSSDNAANRA